VQEPKHNFTEEFPGVYPDLRHGKTGDRYRFVTNVYISPGTDPILVATDLAEDYGQGTFNNQAKSPDGKPLGDRWLAYYAKVDEVATPQPTDLVATA